MSMRIFILISVILFTALTGCERVNQVVQPEATTTPTRNDIKNRCDSADAQLHYL